ncbi:MAG: MarR family winged helix-turn-helix transcriptional regulator [Rhizobiaceae bacterium]
MTNQKQTPSIEFECVAQNLRRAARLVTRRYDEALRPLDLTASQFTILQALHRGKAVPQGMLAEILGFEQTTMTRLVALMGKRTLITVLPDPNDKRGRLLIISDEGMALYNHAQPLWFQAQSTTLGRMHADEWNGVRKALTTLSQET